MTQRNVNFTAAWRYKYEMGSVTPRRLTKTIHLVRSIEILFKTLYLIS